jgi:hypothetical protein
MLGWQISCRQQLPFGLVILITSNHFFLCTCALGNGDLLFYVPIPPTLVLHILILLYDLVIECCND